MKFPPRYPVRPGLYYAIRIEVAVREGGIAGQVVDIDCTYCGDLIRIDWTEERPRFTDAEGRSMPELDHVTPRYLCGPDIAENLVPACMPCNRSKGRLCLTPELLDRALARAQASDEARAWAHAVADASTSARGGFPSRPYPLSTKSSSKQLSRVSARDAGRRCCCVEIEGTT